MSKKKKGRKKVDPLMTRVECGSLPDGRVGQFYHIPRLGFTVGLDPQNSRMPIAVIFKDDGSLRFQVTPSGPVATIATKSGHIVLSSMGLRIFEKSKKTTSEQVKLISWSNAKEFADTWKTIVTTDLVFQESMEFFGAILRICELTNFIQLIIDSVYELVDCTKEFVEAVYRNVNEIWKCMNGAYDDFDDCLDDCGRFSLFCKGDCLIEFLSDEARCAVHGIVRQLVEAADYIETCIVKRGVINEEEQTPSTGDIVLFAADSAAGHVIDHATCGYGYSHAGLVCNSRLIDATSEGIEDNPLDQALNREHSIIRLDLTDSQVEALCNCVRSKNPSDFDYIEAVTFGTIDSPGKEMCTMLIMHCLDEIGVDRAELGLAGFVSPNDIARTYGAPRL